MAATFCSEPPDSLSLIPQAVAAPLISLLAESWVEQGTVRPVTRGQCSYLVPREVRKEPSRRTQLQGTGQQGVGSTSAGPVMSQEKAAVGQSQATLLGLSPQKNPCSASDPDEPRQGLAQVVAW